MRIQIWFRTTATKPKKYLIKEKPPNSGGFFVLWLSVIVLLNIILLWELYEKNEKTSNRFINIFAGSFVCAG